MRHPWQAQVLHKRDAPGDLGRDVQPRQVAAHDGELRCRAQHALRLCLHVQHVAGDQFAIADAAAVRRLEGAVAHLQLLGGDAQALCGQAREDHSHLGRGIADGSAAVLHGVAAGGVALVGGARSVRGDDRQPRRVDHQFLGGDLHQGRLDALAQFGLAGEDGDPAIGADLDPAVEEGQLGETAGQRGRAVARARGRCGGGGPTAGSQAEGDHQRATAGQHGTPGEEGAHVACPVVPAAADCQPLAALCTARRMRMWVPQRHRLIAMCSRISASLGEELRSSSACARMTIPAMQ
ncbi:MAG: hypothetical protein JWP60_1120 [Ramlibacter sp.]|nr:hypothetical protein [Ramlibacter sp.]